MLATPKRWFRKGRRWLWRRSGRSHEPHGAVLMYHRVAVVDHDPWQICVQPKHFEAQIRALSSFADIVPLHQLETSLRAGRRARPVIAITFDDGYVDNLVAAKPVLAAHGAPATVFLATGYIGSGRAFWWDVLEGIILRSRSLPTRLRLEAEGEEFSFDDPNLAARGEVAAKARRQLLDALWQWLVGLDDAPRRAALEELASWSGHTDGVDAGSLPMSTQQVTSLVEGGVVSIGAHTINHALLTGLDVHQKRKEIELSRSACAELTGEMPACFAYPFGEFDLEAVGCARDAGFDVACTADPDLVWRSGDALRMPRIAVGDWPAEFLLRRLKWYWFA